MTTIFLLFLFITQMISIYFIVLLYTKVSKFNDLEKKQNKLMQEMDDAIAAYLTEIKDENDKLIDKLSNKTATVKQRGEQPIERVEENVNLQQEETPPVQWNVPRKSTFHQAQKSYAAIQQQTAQPEVLDDRTRAVQLYGEGKSIEEIAKTLGKGRTEIELILKFK